MSNFVWDETALPADKTDAINVPAGASLANYIRATDVNAIFNALREIRLAAYKGGGVATPAASAPTEGTHEPGDLVFNSSPTEAGFLGWVCLTAGTPGQWRKFGLIANASGAFPASAIANTPSGNLAATDQQAVNNELQSDIDGRALAAHNHNGTYQPLDADLTAIAALAATVGLLKKTGADTWTIDTTAYATDAALTAHVNDTTDAHLAEHIGVSGVTGLSATNVKAALAEHQSDIDALAGGGGNFLERKGSGTTAPASGTYAVGDIWVNSAPSVGEPWGWICTAAGTPGTWKEMGNVYDEAAGQMKIGTSGTVVDLDSTGLAWNGGGKVKKILTGSLVYDPPSIASGGGADYFNVTVTGAAVGDPVIGVSYSGSIADGMSMTAHVNAADTVRVRLFNGTASSQNLASGTFRVIVADLT